MKPQVTEVSNVDMSGCKAWVVQGIDREIVPLNSVDVDCLDEWGQMMACMGLLVLALSHQISPSHLLDP